MKPGKAREVWVRALRSGVYKQGKGRLRREDDSYCCLGVACELYRQVEGEGGWYGGGEFEDATGDSSSAQLPRAVQAWLGLRDTYGSVDLFPGNSLTTLNDDGYTFDEIANIIEAEEVRLSDRS